MNQWNILTSEEYVELTKQRLLNTVDKSENGCWIWKGYLCSPKMQYGLTSSLIDGKKKKILAHRLSFRLFNGKIPEGQCVLHKCDNTKCVNPDHLWLGSNKDNQHDMINKGRARKSSGETCALSKLKTEQVLEIRKMRSEGALYREITEKFKIGMGTVAAILQRQSWKHL